MQLEDYDWVITGNHGATGRAVEEATARLGYPIAQQHYFAGFVLRPEERVQWRDIEFAARAAIARGCAQTYIWALPQVARDGFTFFHLGDESEDDVQAFDDILFPIEIGREAEAKPRAPVHGQVMQLANGDLRLSWIPRTRFDVGWLDFVDVPMVDGLGNYEIGIFAGGVLPIATYQVSENEFLLNSGMLAFLQNVSTGPFQARIVQVGMFDRSASLTIELGI